jgi:cholesterol transport system auxiliary component
MTRPFRSTIPLSRRGVLVIGSASLLLAGCGGSSLIGPSQEPLQIYVLKPPLRKLDNIPAVGLQLTIEPPDAAQSLQTTRIALQRGQTMDFYANAQWTDAVPQLLQSLLVEAFETSGSIKGVAPESTGVRGDMVLETEIRSFQANYEDQTGAPDVVVTIVARLLTAGKRDVVGTFISSHDARATQNTVPSVVEAFDEATGQTLEEIVGWALKTAPRAGASPRRS